MTCILNDYKRGGCKSCAPHCQHAIALNGLNGNGGRVGVSGLPAEYRGITLNTSPARKDQRQIYETLTERYVPTFERQFGDSPRIKSLYLWSESPGTGKTTTASALLNEWLIASYLGAIKRGMQPAQVSAIFFDVNAFQTDYNLATMTSDETGMKRLAERIKRVQQAPFAVLDDIGIRGATEAFRAYLHAVINYRVTNGLPTVYTSNLPMADLTGVFDARLYDRIRDQCIDMHFTGASKRGRR
ncbi:P-loop NTPase family protein [Sporosarcina sp. ITBMC105]